MGGVCALAYFFFTNSLSPPPPPPPPSLGSSIEGLVAKKEKINQHGERIEQDRSAVAGFKL